MNCRLCDHDQLDEVIDLGNQYLSDFRDDGEMPPRHPLVALICPHCSLVQLSETVSREEMYHERYGFKSGVSRSIRNDLASVVRQALEVRPDARSWLDIASNDGTLLSYVNGDIIDQSGWHERIYRVGCDPIAKYCKEAEQHADEIHCDFFRADLFPNPFDVITSISMFYDLDDPNGFVDQVKQVLAPDGIWVVQQNYLLKTLKYGAVDNFCHEHITYFTLATMQRLLGRHGLTVFHVESSDVNGGSIRTLICRAGVIEPNESVERYEALEEGEDSDNPWRYEGFAGYARKNRHELRKIVHKIPTVDRIHAFGASTRGSTLLQYANIETRIAAAVDRNPEKVGKVWGGLGIPIISEREAREDPPEWMLITPWFFRDEILAREQAMLEAGTKAIIPLPIPHVVDRAKAAA